LPELRLDEGDEGGNVLRLAAQLEARDRARHHALPVPLDDPGVGVDDRRRQVRLVGGHGASVELDAAAGQAGDRRARARRSVERVAARAGVGGEQPQRRSDQELARVQEVVVAGALLGRPDDRRQAGEDAGHCDRGDGVDWSGVESTAPSGPKTAGSGCSGRSRASRGSFAR
jgi:hypothetical protein